MDLLGFHFEEPLWLLAALLGPLAVAAGLWRERRLRALLFPGLARLGGAGSTWRTRVRHLPLILAALGLVLGAVALARPQRGFSRQNVTTQGVDIVVALDVSGSMAAEDFQPRNRLEVAKDVVADFVRRRPNDRIGLVIFSGVPLTKSPPTTDTAMFLRQLDDVKLEQLPDGTAIGSGLATALTRLRHSQAKSRIVVLVTDGVNNTGEIDPATASDMARAMGVRVYTIGVGKGGTVPLPVKMRDPFSGQVVRRTLPMQVDIDLKLLADIARRTNAETFRATDSGALRDVFARIDQLEKSEIKLTVLRRFQDAFRPVLLAAALCLALGALLWAAGLRVAPA